MYIMSSDNLTDSPDGPMCGICFIKLDDVPYAMINDDGEKGKYHVHCLNQWIQKSNRGILIEQKVNSYSIYHEDKLIDTVVNNKPSQIIDNNQPIQVDTAETTILIPSHENNEEDNSSDSGREYPCYMHCNKGQIMCAGIAIVFIIGVMLFSYLFKHY